MSPAFGFCLSQTDLRFIDFIIPSIPPDFLDLLSFTRQLHFL